MLLLQPHSCNVAEHTATNGANLQSSLNADRTDEHFLDRSWRREHESDNQIKVTQLNIAGC